jgi:hypothetical protein
VHRRWEEVAHTYGIPAFKKMTVVASNDINETNLREFNKV